MAQEKDNEGDKLIFLEYFFKLFHPKAIKPLRLKGLMSVKECEKKKYLLRSVNNKKNELI